MPWVQLTAPAAPAVNLSDLKDHLRLTTNDEDGLLSLYAEAATDLAEKATGRVFIQRTFRLDAPDFPRECDPIRLPVCPVVSVQSVQYWDPTPTLLTWASSNYHLDLTPVRATINPKTGVTYPDVDLDRPNAMQVSFTAGYGTSYQSVPAGIRHLIFLLAAHMFSNRMPVGGTSMEEMPLTYRYALNAYKVVPL